MRIDVVTIFPELVDVPLRTSIIGRAVEAGVVEIGVRDLREHGLGRHRTVDDEPYGGGAGMVMRPEPLFAAIEPLRAAGAQVVLLDPAGDRLTDALARELATVPHLALVCGRYEGIDDRVRTIVDREVSIGDYVLTGGELPALVLIDSIVRLLPGAISQASHEGDSFASGLLGVSAVHAPGDLSRPWRAADPAVGQPWRGRSLASPRGPAPHEAAPPRPARERTARRGRSSVPGVASGRVSPPCPLEGGAGILRRSRPRQAVAFVCHVMSRGPGPR